MTKRRKLKRSDVIMTKVGRDGLGQWYWCELPVRLYDGDPPFLPGTEIHGPFATEDECNEDQRVVLLGPDATVEYGRNHDTFESLGDAADRVVVDLSRWRP
jgi:hypothetical protein